MVGLMRFIAYLCAVVESDANGLNSPTTCWLVDRSTTLASL